MMRKSISLLARVRIFDACGGKCHLCGLKINASLGEAWEVEHVKSLWLGGADDESNMKPAHVHCHAEKTGEESGIKSKTDRIREKHLGIKPKRKWRWG